MAESLNLFEKISKWSENIFYIICISLTLKYFKK